MNIYISNFNTKYADMKNDKITFRNRTLNIQCVFYCLKVYYFC